jgi:hypothetical protein
MEVETKHPKDEETYSEINYLRAEIQRLKDEKTKVTKEQIQGVIEHIHFETSLTKEQIELITNAVYPLLKGLDIVNKTLVFEIPMNGTIPDDLLQRYCAYVDYLKQMGAKNVVFISKESKLESLSDRDLERSGLRRI